MEEKELLSEEMLEKIMMGVAIAGTAKSLGKEALNQANQGDFLKASSSSIAFTQWIINGNSYFSDNSI